MALHPGGSDVVSTCSGMHSSSVSSIPKPGSFCASMSARNEAEVSKIGHASIRTTETLCLLGQEPAGLAG
jgi:hypothetical protein